MGKGIGMNKSRAIRFGSMAEFVGHAQLHPAAKRAMSPGGASHLLGVSRQRVYEMVDQGHLRAWFVYEYGHSCFDVPGNRATYVFISEDDVRAYMGKEKSKGGRPKKVLTESG